MSGHSSVMSLREYLHMPKQMMEAAANAMASTTCDLNTACVLPATNEIAGISSCITKQSCLEVSDDTTARVLKKRHKKHNRQKKKSKKVKVTVVVRSSDSDSSSES